MCNRSFRHTSLKFALRKVRASSSSFSLLLLSPFYRAKKCTFCAILRLKHSSSFAPQHFNANIDTCNAIWYILNWRFSFRFYIKLKTFGDKLCCALARKAKARAIWISNLTGQETFENTQNKYKTKRETKKQFFNEMQFDTKSRLKHTKRETHAKFSFS